MYDVPSLPLMKKYRTALGLTQTELARRSGVSQSLIARIEAGDIDPRLSTFRKIMNALRTEELAQTFDVTEVMRAPVIHVTSEDTVGKAHRLMEEYGISQLPVLDDGIQVGAVSETRLLRKMAQEKEVTRITERRVEELMDEGFPTLGVKTDLELLSRLMEDHPAALIVDKGRTVGIVTKADLLRLMSP